MSLLVIVLLFIAVSTATYAWYSAINRALGDSITFSSSSYDQMGSELTIGWTRDSIFNEITFDEPDSSLYPMIPKTHPVIGVTTFNEFTNFNFNYSAQSFDNELHAWICSFAGQNSSPFICTGGEVGEKKSFFYLINKKTTDKQTVTVRYVINGELAEYLRVALFIGDAVDGYTDQQNIANMRFYGILSNNDLIHYSLIRERDIVDETPVMDNVHKPSSSISFVLNENSAKCIALVAWLDGVHLDNEDAQKSTTFNITFDGVLGDTLS